jgi:hypothetical protein
MNWIEQVFGLSPDGGDGTTEVMIVLTACVLVGALIYARVPGVRSYVRNLLRPRLPM